MKLPGVVVTCVIVSLLTVYAVGTFTRTDGKATVTTGSAESVYDRVMKNKILRCGYVTWAPFLVKDTNTGKMSGFFYDYMEEFGRAFDLKIEWKEEIAYTDIPAALSSDRIDAMCVALGAVPSRIINMNFSRPVLYFPFFAYVRKDDTRFDKDLNALNDPNVTMSTMEGEYTSILARTTYPKAKLMEITALEGTPALFLNVQNKKADVIFQDSASFRDYNAKNPDILRQVGSLVGAIPVGFIVKKNDPQIQRLFDYGISDLENRLITKRLVEQYGMIGKPDREPDVYLPTPGYQF